MNDRPGRAFRAALIFLAALGFAAALVALSSDDAGGQPVCETVPVDPPSVAWSTWRPFAYLVAHYSDGTDAVFVDVPAGVLLVAPEGATIERYTKCDTPPVSPTAMPTPSPTPTPAPSPTSTAPPEGTPTASPTTTPSPTPSATPGPMPPTTPMVSPTPGPTFTPGTTATPTTTPCPTPDPTRAQLLPPTCPTPTASPRPTPTAPPTPSPSVTPTLPSPSPGSPGTSKVSELAETGYGPERTIWIAVSLGFAGIALLQTARQRLARR